MEILIATLLFTVGVLSVSALLSNAFVTSSDIENETIAGNLAQERIEKARNTGFTLITDEARTDVAGFPRFQRSVDVTEAPTGLKKVTVTVYWTLRGSEVSQSLITYIGNT